jgi:hypothetical protein
MRRRVILNVFCVTAIGLLHLVTLSSHQLLSAQQAGGLPDLEKRLAALETKVADLAQVNTSQAAEIAALKQRLSQAEAKLVHVSVEGTEMYITGANVNIRNGLGATNGNPDDPQSTNPSATAVNGLGNLVIGYNAGGFSVDRGGSHYLVLGDFNNYSSFGGIAAGWDNFASGPYASTLGGRSNDAEAAFSSIVGGAFNLTDGNTASILGGNDNRASAIDATVCGGSGNRATARFSTVGGGAGILQSTEFGWSAGSFGPVIQGSFVSP